MHFPSIYFILLAAFAGSILLLFTTLGHFNDEDRMAYYKLIEGGKKVEGEEQQAQTSNQHRLNLQKDVLFFEKGQRLQLRVFSDSADIDFERSRGRTAVIEHLKNAVCYLQEGIFSLPEGNSDHPLQRVLFLQADTATYHYQNELLIAENVKISRYLAPGHSLDQASTRLGPSMSGKAGHVELLLSSKSFDPNGGNAKKIILKDHVVIEHELGKVGADQIVLTSLPEVKKMPFGLLRMDGHVAIALNNGGNLSCSKASFDCRTYRGCFLSDQEQPEVVYRESGFNKKGQCIPLVVKSRRMDLYLNQNKAGAKNHLNTCIREIKAEDQVTIGYNNDYIAVGEHASYLFDEAFVPAKAKASGVITLTGDGQNSFCQVTNSQGNRIQACQISVNTIKRELIFTHPRGVLAAAQKEGIDFSAETLIWDDISGTLTLKDAVKINQKGMGKLQTDKEMRISQHMIDGQKKLHKIEVDENTLLTHADEDGNPTCVLTCYGKASVDHQKMEAKLYSPLDANGHPFPEKQVFFQDVKGDVFADKALIRYEYRENKIIPAQIILLGNVRIFNQLPSHDDETKIVLQYALADRVELSLSSQEMIFKAKPGNRVLFFDKTNNLEASAPALKIVRDKATRKESIQGMGDVRFSFAEHELEQLRRKFSLDKEKVEFFQNQEEA